MWTRWYTTFGPVVCGPTRNRRKATMHGVADGRQDDANTDTDVWQYISTGKLCNESSHYLHGLDLHKFHITSVPSFMWIPDTIGLYQNEHKLKISRG